MVCLPVDFWLRRDFLEVDDMPGVSIGEGLAFVIEVGGWRGGQEVTRLRVGFQFREPTGTGQLQCRK